MRKVRIIKEISQDIKATGGDIRKIPTGSIGVSGNTNTRSTQYTGNLIYPIYKPNMMSEPTREARTTLGPVKDGSENMEAEKGETALLPDVEGLSAHYDITGHRHSEGGTPLNLPKDAFIYSDTAKMKIKDPDILKFFGKTGNSYTPADIAKQYGINDYRTILSDNTITDPIHIRTAENMISNYNNKLGKLALIQESMKGYPQGLPAAALPYLAKTQIDPNQVLPLTSNNQSQQPNQVQPVNQATMADGGPVHYPYSYHAGPQDWANMGNALMQDGGPFDYNQMKQKLQQIRDEEERRRSQESNKQTSDVLQSERDREYSDMESQMNKIKDLADKNKYTSMLNFLPRGIEPTTVETELRGLEGMAKRYNIPITTPPVNIATPTNISTTPNYSRPVAQTPTVITYEQLRNLPKESRAAIANDLPDTTRQRIIKEGQAYKSKLPTQAYGGNLPIAQVGKNIDDEFLAQLQDASKKKSSTKATPASTTISTKSSPKAAIKEPDFPQTPEAVLAYLKTKYPNTHWPESMVPGLQPKETLGINGVTSPEVADKNWSWRKKPIDWSRIDPKTGKSEEVVGSAQDDYNKELKKRFTDAGEDSDTADKLVKVIGFAPYNSKNYKGFMRDATMGEYTKNKVMPDIEPKAPITSAPAPIVAKDTPLVPNPEPQAYHQPANAPWFAQDVIKTAGAAGDFNRIHKYLPWAAPITPYVPEPTFYDPTRELGETAEQANMGTRGAATFGSPQDYSARAAAIQGSAAKAAADVLGKYNNLNVGTSNQFAAQKADIYNRANESNVNTARDLYDKTTMANQEYDNSKAKAREELRSSYIDAITNRANAQVMNTQYPNFHIDPSTGGMLDFYKGSKIRPMYGQDQMQQQANYFDFVKAHDPSMTWDKLYGREKEVGQGREEVPNNSYGTGPTYPGGRFQ